MFRSRTEMNTSSAAGFGGRFFAAMTSHTSEIADTVVSVAAVFFRGAVSGARLCFPVLSSVPDSAAALIPCTSSAPMR